MISLAQRFRQAPSFSDMYSAATASLVGGISTTAAHECSICSSKIRVSDSFSMFHGTGSIVEASKV